MKFNLVNQLADNAPISKVWSYNHVIAWQLRKALQAAGHEAVFVPDRATTVPECTNTIIISNVAMTAVRNSSEYLKMHREATENKMCLWLDSDMGNWNQFDYVFCVNRSHNLNPEQFKRVGWATDFNMFSPKQIMPVAFVDPYMYGWYQGTCDRVYDSIRKVLASTDIVHVQPVERYNHGRIPWLSMAELLSQCSYFVATQIANWGLVNLEAATCGALLVIHELIDRPETFPSELNYVTWSTEDELTEILKKPVDIQANRKVALKNSWGKVVKNIMEALRE